METVSVQTAELVGAPLDWAAGKAGGGKASTDRSSVLMWLEARSNGMFCYSSNWGQAGDIIDSEDIVWMLPEYGDENPFCAFPYRVGTSMSQHGPTKLVAAMRCYVAYKLGAVVEIPKELLS